MAWTGTHSVAELNNYIKQEGREFFKTLFVTAEHFNKVDVWTGVTNKTPLTHFTATDILQPSLRNGTVNLKGDIAPSSRFLDPQAGKADVSIVFESFNKQYDSAMRRAGALNNGTEPPTFFEWVVNEVILARMMDNMCYAQWRGVRNDAATTVAATCDGFKAQIDAAVTAGTIVAGNVKTGDALTAANAYDMISNFVDAIDPVQQDVENIIYCDPKYVRWFIRDRNTTFGQGLDDARDMSVMMNDYNTRLVGIPALAGVTDFYLTTPGNFVTGVETVEDATNWRIYEKERSQVFLADVVMANNFAVPSLTWVRKNA